MSKLTTYLLRCARCKAKFVSFTKDTCPACGYGKTYVKGMITESDREKTTTIYKEV